MNMRASLLITAKDAASSTLARIGAKARQLGQSFKPVAKEAGAAGIRHLKTPIGKAAFVRSCRSQRPAA